MCIRVAQTRAQWSRPGSQLLHDRKSVTRARSRFGGAVVAYPAFGKRIGTTQFNSDPATILIVKGMARRIRHEFADDHPEPATPVRLNQQGIGCEHEPNVHRIES